MTGEQGGALLEFALVFPVFVFVLYGLIAFGMILSAKNSLTHAAAEGARAAVGAPDDATAIARAKSQVNTSLGWMGTNYQSGDTTATAAYCSGSSGARCITVTITYPYSTRPLIPTAPGLNLVTPSTISATSVLEYTS